MTTVLASGIIKETNAEEGVVWNELVFQVDTEKGVSEVIIRGVMTEDTLDNLLKLRPSDKKPGRLLRKLGKWFTVVGLGNKEFFKNQFNSLKLILVAE